MAHGSGYETEDSSANGCEDDSSGSLAWNHMWLFCEVLFLLITTLFTNMVNKEQVKVNTHRARDEYQE
ncbi:hypothetical protein J5N97_019560 [Dioscorea zingiberensis]|uniref:Uncharacterized protein n=1 Tax=Dioscorea zingiberensis TaxID=325984 RepID=A0A9D5CE35_9LILI|nr:hypothetical protein J5N97_019560 [Dioscorea zingiberensis]